MSASITISEQMVHILRNDMPTERATLARRYAVVVVVCKKIPAALTVPKLEHQRYKCHDQLYSPESRNEDPNVANVVAV